MSAETETIRSFLVSLGFAVDTTQEKKFTGSLEKTGKTALAAGKGILAVATAAQAMVAVFTSNLEKLYYASQRTGASVGNLQSMESGAKRIGLQAGEATAALENMAAAVRMNPGMRGLMDTLVGHDSAGMDQTAAMLELVQKLAAMPHYMGAQYASMFGIDEKTFLMLKNGLPDMLAQMERFGKLQRDAGLDPDKAAEASQAYQNMMRDLTDKVTILGQKLSIALLDPAIRFAEVINKTLDRLTLWKPGEGLQRFLDWYRGDRKDAPPDAMGVPGAASGAGVSGTPSGMSASGTWDDINARNRATQAGRDADRRALIAQELADEKDPERRAILQRELSRLGPAPAVAPVTMPTDAPVTGAQGKAVRKALNTDFGKFARRAYADFLSVMPGNNEELIRLARPVEPAGVAEKVDAARADAASRSGTGGAAPSVKQENHIHIDGSGRDVDDALREAEDFMRRMNADVVRNFKGAIQ